MVTINGEALDAGGKTLADYLAEAGYEQNRIAVERNGEIVPKASYGETRLQDYLRASRRQVGYVGTDH